MVKRLGAMMALLVWCTLVQAQPVKGRGDSWQEVFNNKKGTVTGLWDDMGALYLY